MFICIIIVQFQIKKRVNVMNREKLIEALTPKVNSLGLKINDIDKDLMHEFELFLAQGIEITDNLLNPNLSIPILVLYCNGITQTPDTESRQEAIQVLPYIHPNMSISHFRLIQEAIHEKNNVLLVEYKKIFENTNLSADQKLTMAELAKAGDEYSYIANVNYTKQQHQELQRVTRQKHSPNRLVNILQTTSSNF